MAILVTSEKAKDSNLKSNYYQTSYTILAERLTVILQKKGYILTHRDDRFFELEFQGKYRILATILMDTPRKTRLDLLFESSGLFKGPLKKELKDIQISLSKEFPVL